MRDAEKLFRCECCGEVSENPGDCGVFTEGDRVVALYKWCALCNDATVWEAWDGEPADGEWPGSIDPDEVRHSAGAARKLK